MHVAHRSCIKNSELQATVYHNLRVLLKETDCHKFEQLLHETAKQLNKSSVTTCFGQYFQTYYAINKVQWAACYRKEAFVTINMYADAFWRVLKYVYVKGKVNKRVDNCSYILLKLAREQRVWMSGKDWDRKKYKESMIKLRHQWSLKLPYTHVMETENSSTWEVESLGNKTDYSIVQVHLTCPYNRLIPCPECKIHIHMFVCNCPAASIRTTICKHIHIHLVARFTSHYVEQHSRKVYRRSQMQIVIARRCKKNYMALRNLVTLLYLEKKFRHNYYI